MKCKCEKWQAKYQGKVGCVKCLTHGQYRMAEKVGEDPYKEVDEIRKKQFGIPVRDDKEVQAWVKESEKPIKKSKKKK